MHFTRQACEMGLRSPEIPPHLITPLPAEAAAQADAGGVGVRFIR